MKKNFIDGRLAGVTSIGLPEEKPSYDGDGVGHIITRVQHDASGTARGVEGEHGLNGDVHGRSVEGLKHDLRHLLAVCLRVEGGLSE